MPFLAGHSTIHPLFQKLFLQLHEKPAQVSHGAVEIRRGGVAEVLEEERHPGGQLGVEEGRLIRHLVSERGCRTVAFEADAAAAAALDAFVRDGSAFAETPRNAEFALAELDMWQWRTASVRELLDWLRAFNADRAPDEQVRVRGVDLSTPSAPAAPLRAYFDRVDSKAENEALRTVADATVPDGAEERDRDLDDVSSAAEALADRLAANREAYESSSSAAWQTARHYCRVIEQACEWARVRHEHPGPHPAGMATRDRFMAENALWALDRDPGSGVALWAHDGHVQRGSFDDGTSWSDVTTMGERLADELGDGYRPVGFDFAHGSFRAVGRGSGEVGTFSVGDPLEGSATAAFAAAEDAHYVLDLDSAADDARLGPWLDAERRTRYVGSVFDPDGDDEGTYAETDLPASFDWLLVLPESTPTAPTECRQQNP